MDEIESGVAGVHQVYRARIAELELQAKESWNKALNYAVGAIQSDMEVSSWQDALDQAVARVRALRRAK